MHGGCPLQRPCVLLPLLGERGGLVGGPHILQKGLALGEAGWSSAQAEDDASSFCQEQSFLRPQFQVQAVASSREMGGHGRRL